MITKLNYVTEQFKYTGNNTEEEDEDESSEELLERLATRHYYSYTAALGVTVGVGCLLLVLNMLIFAGIYYQVRKILLTSERREKIVISEILA